MTILEGVAGAGWTFENRVDLSLRAGVFNLFANRPWQNSAPGSFYLLNFGFFF